MALYTGTTYQATTPEIWDTNVDEARYANSVILPKVMTKTDLVAKFGDIVNMSYEDKLTVSTVNTSTGAFTPTTHTLTGVQLTLNQYEIVSAETVNIATQQSFYNVHDGFSTKAGKAFAERYDTVLASLYGSFTNVAVGEAGSPVTFDEAAITTAMLRLDDRDIPIADRAFVVNPAAFYKGIASRPQFVDCDKTGKNQSLLTTGWVGNLKVGGAPLYITTRLSTADQAKAGMLFHRSAMAIAFSFKNDYMKGNGLAANKMTEISTVTSAYGYTVFRGDHGVALYLKQS